jgi:small GTP-binding protein
MTQKGPLSFRILLLGENCVGKTCIFHQLIHHEFCDQVPTVLCTSALYSCEVDSRPVNVTVFDTPGNERFLALVHIYAKGAIGAILVYDLSDGPTCDSLYRGWIDWFLYAVGPEAKVAIVGNKADLVKEGGEVEGRARMFAKENGYAHYTVSGKTGEGIDTLFKEFTESIVRSGLLGEPTEGKKPQSVIERRDKNCSVD